MSEEKAKYKARRARRLNGSPPEAREIMPWWYESAMADFNQREKEQAAAALKGPLSSNPNVPWGHEKPKRMPGEEYEGRRRERVRT